MADCDDSEARLRCVIPFRAEAREIRVLRRLVALQLACWARPTVTDEAELVVTELATNVLNHVGAGAAGVLIVEAHHDLLRLEVHDRNYATPAPVGLTCDSECGRGLHLVAHMAADWGTMLTASGKAVWCELVVKGANEPDAPAGGRGALAPASGEGGSVQEGGLKVRQAAEGLVGGLLGLVSLRYESEPDAA